MKKEHLILKKGNGLKMDAFINYYPRVKEYHEQASGELVRKTVERKNEDGNVELLCENRVINLQLYFPAPTKKDPDRFISVVLSPTDVIRVGKILEGMKNASFYVEEGEIFEDD